MLNVTKKEIGQYTILTMKKYSITAELFGIQLILYSRSYPDGGKLKADPDGGKLKADPDGGILRRILNPAFSERQFCSVFFEKVSGRERARFKFLIYFPNEENFASGIWNKTIDLIEIKLNI